MWDDGRIPVIVTLTDTGIIVRKFCVGEDQISYPHKTTETKIRLVPIKPLNV
jgi:hypothetical protein